MDTELIDAPEEATATPAAAADIEIGLYSRWVDEKARLFIVVGRHEPQLHNARLRSTRFDLLAVNEEFARSVTRDDLEKWIRAGALNRVLDTVFSLV